MPESGSKYYSALMTFSNAGGMFRGDYLKNILLLPGLFLISPILTTNIMFHAAAEDTIMAIA